MRDLARDILLWSQWTVLVYFVVINTWYGALLVSSWMAMRRHLRRAWEQRHWRAPMRRRTSKRRARS